jgi:hypothetical protein
MIVLFNHLTRCTVLTPLPLNFATYLMAMLLILPIPPVLGCMGSFFDKINVHRIACQTTLIVCKTTNKIWIIL